MLDWIFISLVAMGAGFYLLSIAAVLFGIRRGPARNGPTPGVSVLKPLKEAIPDLYENLASFCRLDYPDFQIILGLASESDAAYPIAQKIQADFPQADVRIVVKEAAVAGSPRAANLANMMIRAKNDVLLVSDDDTRVEPNFLSRLAEPFADGQMGAVTAPFCARRGPGMLTINLETLPFGLIGAALGATVANGAALGLRRAALDKIGGFEAAAEQAGDNFWIVKSVSAAGYQTVVLSHPVEMRPGAGPWRRQLRSDRTDRFLNPWLAFGRIFTQGLFWALVYVAASAASELSLWTLASIAGLRLLTVLAIAMKLRAPRMLAWAWLAPLRDLGSVAIWIWSWFGSTIRFHGKTYRFVGGRRVQVTPDRGA